VRWCVDTEEDLGSAFVMDFVAGEREPPAGPREAAKISVVRPAGAPPHRDPFARGDDLVHREREVRKRPARVLDALAVGALVERPAVPCVPRIRVDDVLGRDEARDRVEVAAAPDGIVELPDELLVRAPGGAALVAGAEERHLLEREPPDVLRPPGDERLEPRRVRLEERARRLLVVRPVAGHAREEATERGLDPPHALVPGALLDRVLDEPPQGARDPRVLLLEPVPVPGQERHLAARDPELRPARPWPGRRALEHLVQGAAEIEVHLPPRPHVEHEHELRGIPVEAVLQHGQDVPKDAVRYLPDPRESHKSIGDFHAGHITRVKQLSQYYPGVIRRSVADAPGASGNGPA